MLFELGTVFDIRYSTTYVLVGIAFHFLANIEF